MAAQVESQRPRLAWSIDDLAQALDVCRDRLYADIRAGKLMARRIGARRTIVTDDEVRRYLEALPQVELPPAEEQPSPSTGKKRNRRPRSIPADAPGRAQRADGART